MNLLTPAQSIQKWLGKEVSFEGYPGECLSWVKQFMADTQGFTPPGQVAGGIGGAVDYWNKFAQEPGLSQYYTQIVNDRADINQVPSQYDIVIWDGDVPGSQGFGHIDVFNATTAGSSIFSGWDQNWANNQTVHVQQHVWLGQGTILGWLHAKNLLSASVPSPVAVSSSLGTVTLPTKNADGSPDTVWHLYNVGGPYVPASAKGILDPAEFGSLSYPIEGYVDNNQGVIITTQDFGQGVVWIAGTNAILSS